MKKGHISTGHTGKYKTKTIVLIVAFILVFFGSFMLGRYPIMPDELILILLSKVFEISQTWPDAAETVVFNIRMPRVLAAGLVGASLAVAGVSYQGMFQNPMVSPGVLGASSGAGCGAALAILLGFSYYAISFMAFLFGLGAVLLAYLISRMSRINPVLAMVLGGMLISSLFASGTSFIKLVADTESALPAITYWLMGSLVSIQKTDILFAIFPIIVGMVPLWLLRWRINLLTVGEEEALSMGIDTTKLRLIVIVCATLLTAISVSISGVIGWVGLVIPHFCRMIFGYDYRRLIPTNILFGATFLMVVDNIARMVTTGEIPIGILTSFIGAPIFAYLILTGGAIRGD
ncbi:MAG: FecCD family ABC transporter permease [Lentihominibacter sp.]|jgi:iron complex transport system permease protein